MAVMLFSYTTSNASIFYSYSIIWQCLQNVINFMWPHKNKFALGGGEGQVNLPKYLDKNKHLTENLCTMLTVCHQA